MTQSTQKKRKRLGISTSLRNGLTATINAAADYSGEFRVEVIEINQIEFDPDNPRELDLTLRDVYHGIEIHDPMRQEKQAQIEQLQSLKNSILKSGVLYPVTLYEYKDHFRLATGERRTLASALAGKSTIKAQILAKKPTELALRQIQWFENIERHNLTLAEKLKNLTLLQDAYLIEKNKPRLDRNDLMEIIGCERTQADKYLMLLNGDNMLTQLVLNRKINSIDKFVLIAKQKDDGLQEDLRMMASDGATQNELEQFIKTDKSNKKEKRRKAYNRKGRPQSKIRFGETNNVFVARVVFEAICQHHLLSAQIGDTRERICWDDVESINKGIKELIQSIEKLSKTGQP